ncbi:MAG: thioredoxin family protein [Fimbriimonadaceae bacterium]|nr:thioredoxin family protein [Chthonomonadaceae bacterium]MCO5296045.1 thioredoxin family protein [Fimbriimonadaceae bacterium]
MAVRGGMTLAGGVVLLALLCGCGGGPVVGKATKLAVPADFYPLKPKPVPAVWSSTLEEGLARARHEGKPLLVFFGTDWCLNCRAYTKSMFPEAEFIEAAKPFVLVKIDVDRDEKLADRYAVNGIPDVLFMDPQGTVLERVVGYQAEGLYKWFPRALEKFEREREGVSRSASRQPTASPAG